LKRGGGLEKLIKDIRKLFLLFSRQLQKNPHSCFQDQQREIDRNTKHKEKKWKE